MLPCIGIKWLCYAITVQLWCRYCDAHYTHYTHGHHAILRDGIMMGVEGAAHQELGKIDYIGHITVF